MIKLIKTAKVIVNSLTEFYEDELKAVLRSSRTGAPTRLPKDYAARAQLLNLLLYQPEFLLIFSGNIAYSQLDVYRPYFARSKRRFGIITSGMKGKNRAQANLENIPVYVKTAAADPLGLLPAVHSLNALLYVSHKAYNYKCISRNKHVIHTYSGHGFSDKHTAEFRLASAYDYLLRPDATSTHRFLSADISLSPQQFLLVGGSPIEGMKVHSGSSKFENILYAPTWEGHEEEVNFSSVGDVSEAMVEFASNGGNLSFRPHPALGNKREKIKEDSHKIAAVARQNQSKPDAFNASDALVTDISGVLPEYLFSGKPIIIPVPKTSWKNDYLKKTDLENYCYIWDPTAQPLADFLKSISHDPLQDARLHRRSQRFLGSSDLDELCSHFDRALDFMEQAKYQRSLKVMSAAPISSAQNDIFERLPRDRTLKKAIEEVRSGKRVLGLD